MCYKLKFLKTFLKIFGDFQFDFTFKLMVDMETGANIVAVVFLVEEDQKREEGNVTTHFQLLEAKIAQV